MKTLQLDTTILGRLAAILFFGNLAAGTAIAAPANATLEILGPAPGTISTLTAGNDGNFYGTSYDGGAFGGGTVFRMTPSGQIAILKSFEQTNGNVVPIDGNRPLHRMITGPDGRLYGTTSEAGNTDPQQPGGLIVIGDGTIFAVTTAGQFTKLAQVPPESDAIRFTSKVRTWSVIAPLTVGPDEFLYGSREATIFKANPAGGYATIATFKPGSGHTGRAQDPVIVAGKDGNFYGTSYGADYFVPSYAFRMNAIGTMDFFTNGEVAPVPMLEAADGNFYGIGSTIFKLTPAGTLTRLHTFTGPDGAYAEDSLIQGPDGNFYGTTKSGGANDPNASYDDNIGGTVFRVTPAGVLTTLVSFDPSTGTAPRASLVQRNDGCFYGTTSAKGPNGTGTIFRLTAFPPKLTSIIPRSDQNQNRLTIHGQFFSGATGVTVDGVPVKSFVVDSPTQITAFLSPGQTNGTLAVTTPLGSASLNGGQAAASPILNLSSRLGVFAGDNVLIGGFIVSGSANKKLLLRAIGPTLTKAGVASALLDPTLELHDQQGAIIATNDDWRTTQIGGVIANNQVAEIENTGIAPTDDREAAILVTLPPSAYTAIQRGKDNSVGVGLLELYDLSGSSTNSKLANISTRGFVLNRDTVIIGGFIVAQPGAARVIVRAIGPSLRNAGISNPLPDPTIDLRDGNGAQIAFNDNWRDTQEQEVTSSIPPTDPREGAIVATLAAGNYTAIVRGASDNDSGIGLVEIYQLNQ